MRKGFGTVKVCKAVSELIFLAIMCFAVICFGLGHDWPMDLVRFACLATGVEAHRESTRFAAVVARSDRDSGQDIPLPACSGEPCFVEGACGCPVREVGGYPSTSLPRVYLHSFHGRIVLPASVAALPMCP